MLSEESSLVLPHLIMAVSTPAIPGPSTPTARTIVPLEQMKTPDYQGDIIPPERPQSTPFPVQDIHEGDIQCTHRLLESQSYDKLCLPASETTSTSKSPLCALPSEIHECILDYLLGVRASAASRTTSVGESKVLRGWGTALRHSRRGEVSQLALVSKRWRELTQERLYRHLKIKGTSESINNAVLWFTQRPHLCPYVKHIEVWFPVFQQKNPAFERMIRLPSTTPDRSVLIRSAGSTADPGIGITYQSPSDNCSLEDTFRFIQMTFGEACILTLEGGERKKPPQVRHFQGVNSNGSLPVLDKIRTLVCKGQWNLIRKNEDFQVIAAALPNLIEWHGSYAKPKSKSYITMAAILPNLPQHLTHLNICLEADYRREAFAPAYAKKVSRKVHYCAEMAKAIPTLEHLAYTGRVCHEFFSRAALLSNPRETRLKTVDIVVKNVCRPTLQDPGWGDGSGVTEMRFINAFEKLVVAGIRSLGRLAALEFLRIRFVDLESQVPALNPYFQISKDQCTGIWSDVINETLRRARPSAAFVEKPGIMEEMGFKEGQLLSTPNFSKARPLTIKVSSYANISSGITSI